jgi:hypothetical protein
MLPHDQEFESFGAEALPGGLRSINEAMDDRQPPAAKAPVLGLIALALLWRRYNVKRD